MKKDMLIYRMSVRKKVFMVRNKFNQGLWTNNTSRTDWERISPLQAINKQVPITGCEQASKSCTDCDQTSKSCIACGQTSKSFTGCDKTNFLYALWTNKRLLKTIIQDKSIILYERMNRTILCCKWSNKSIIGYERENVQYRIWTNE